MRKTLLAAALLALSASRASAQVSDDQWLSGCQAGAFNGQHASACEVQVKTVPVRAALSIAPGENGAVYVQAYDGTDIQIHARMQASAATRGEAMGILRRLNLDFDKTISVTGPATDTPSWGVSFLIYVPRSTNLSIQTDNGPISIHDVVGTMQLRTVNGPITLRGVGGDVHARAENGPIDVRLSGDRWNGPGLDAYTENGPVSVDVPASYNAVLETGTTNGPVESDFPVTVNLNGRGLKHFTTTLGASGPRVRVVTTNGPVSLRRP